MEIAAEHGIYNLFTTVWCYLVINAFHIYFSGAIVEILNGTSFIAMRSIASKLVPTDELGKLCNYFSIFILQNPPLKEINYERKNFCKSWVIRITIKIFNEKLMSTSYNWMLLATPPYHTILIIDDNSDVSCFQAR